MSSENSWDGDRRANLNQHNFLRNWIESFKNRKRLLQIFVVRSSPFIPAEGFLEGCPSSKRDGQGTRRTRHVVLNCRHLEEECQRQQRKIKLELVHAS